MVERFEAAAEATDGLRRGLARPVALETAQLVMGIVGGLFASAGCVAALARFAVSGIVMHARLLDLVALFALTTGVVLLWLARHAPALVVRRFTVFAHAQAVVASLAVTAGQYAVGPESIAPMVLYTEIPIFAFYLFPRRRAIAVVALIAVEVAVLLAVQGGYPAALAVWFFIVFTVATIGALVGELLLGRAVDESTRLSRLRRFLPAEVADAVLSSGAGEVLRPHRRRIAVMFCDLRGFTRFSGTSEPEEVVEVLDDYFATVGGAIRDAHATVGTFAGDGLMAYFNDPVPCDDPAGRAVELAVRVQASMAALVSSWRRRGYDLDHGIGIAFGYATLGVVGFEGRHEYTPLGSVVNLAARLSDRAGAEEILVDQRTYDATCDRVDTEPRVLALKGFAEPVTAHRVLRAPVGALTSVDEPASG